MDSEAARACIYTACRIKRYITNDKPHRWDACVLYCYYRYCYIIVIITIVINIFILIFFIINNNNAIIVVVVVSCHYRGLYSPPGFNTVTCLLSRGGSCHGCLSREAVITFTVGVAKGRSRVMMFHLIVHFYCYCYYYILFWCSFSLILFSVSLYVYLLVIFVGFLLYYHYYCCCYFVIVFFFISIPSLYFRLADLLSLVSFFRVFFVPLIQESSLLPSLIFLIALAFSSIWCYCLL